MYSPARCLGAALAAVAALVVVATPARAGTNTVRDDDGSREATVVVDRSSDRVAQTFIVPTGLTGSASTVTLGLYARSGSCVAGAATQTIRVGGHVLTEVDPCQVWPSGDYGWATFAVPLSWLHDGTNWLEVRHLSSSTDRTASYGVDKSHWGWNDMWEDDGTDYYRVLGTAMAYLAFDGTRAAPYAPPVDYGLVPPGDTATRTVTVANNGTAAFAPTGLTVGGTNASEFAVTTDGCTGTSVPAGGSCAFDVAFSPAAIGPRTATATLTGNATLAVSLTGQGRSAPPVSAFTTAGGTILLLDDPVAGTVTDDLGVVTESVTFTPVLPPYGATVTMRATLTCDPTATACTWSARPLLFPGIYTVTGHGTDVQGVAESPGPSIQVVVV
jgi:hypothetical protein